MPVILPFQPLIEHYTFRAILAANEYSFEVKWNQKDAAAFFDLRDSTGTAILFGARVTLGAYIGRISPHPLFTGGFLVARPIGSDRSPPTLADIGVRVQVWYFTNGEALTEVVNSTTGNTPPS